MTDRAAATRRQRPRGSVTREAVVFAALAVLDRAGAEALTIRAVARQVGAPPMSLYTHFSNKQELLELMVGEILKHLYQDDGNATWQAELEALCRRVYKAFLGHPHWTPLLTRGMPAAEVPVRERLLAMMVADGMRPQQAFSVLSSALLSTTGFVVAQHILQTANGDSVVGQRYESIRQSSAAASDSPVTREAVAGRAELAMRDVFDVTLRSLVRGYEVLAREAPIST